MQIDPVELAKEIAINIPAPAPGPETWIYGLFAVSGWVVALAVVYYLMKREKREEEKAKEEKALWERIIEALTESRVIMEQSGSDGAEIKTVLREISTKIDNLK